MWVVGNGVANAKFYQALNGVQIRVLVENSEVWVPCSYFRYRNAETVDTAANLADDPPPFILDGVKPDTPVSVPAVTPKEPIPLRLIDEPDEGLADPDLPLPILRKTIYNMGSTSVLTMAERKALAAEKGLPVHLANGIPVLPGGNYWSQSLCVFPMVHARGRSSFTSRKCVIAPRISQTTLIGPVMGKLSSASHFSPTEAVVPSTQR